jgi:hypothetical protein
MSYIGADPSRQVTTPAVDYFNGNGVTTTFQLTRAVTSVNAIQVVVNNVPQNAREAYGITASNQIAFTSAPSAGTNNIYVIYDSQVGQFVTPSPGTVTASSLVTGSVTQSALDTGRLDGTGSMTIPAGTTAQRPTSPTVGMIRFNTTTRYIEYWNPINSSWIGLGDFIAVGGSVVDLAGFRYHTFTASGSFQVLTGAKVIDYLIVAGGGGGAGSFPNTTTGGGGGAGGLLTGTVNAAVGTYSVIVGAGGSGGVGATIGTNGQNSQFGDLIAIGGGRGGSWDGAGDFGRRAGNGGSGGGQSDTSNSAGQAGGLGTAGQGNNGGSGPAYAGSVQMGAGGGGGRGSVGANGTGDANGGNGGSGFTSNISGSSLVYAAGGGGGRGNGGINGLGTAGVSGNGGSYNVNGDAAPANRGGGGGGGGGTDVSGSSFSGGNGGSGIVIIRYQI